jgi:DNA polymerase
MAKSEKIQKMMAVWEDVKMCASCEIAAMATQKVFGEGDVSSRIFLVGEGPGMDEDKTGRPFVGKAGKLLSGVLKELGINRKKIFIANVVKCHPPKTVNPPAGNRKPAPKEISNCIGYLKRQIEIVDPALVVAMGEVAATALIPFEGVVKMGIIVGRVFERTNIGRKVAVCYHPQYLGYREGDRELMSSYLDTMRKFKELAGV